MATKANGKGFHAVTPYLMVAGVPTSSRVNALVLSPTTMRLWAAAMPVLLLLGCGGANREAKPEISKASRSPNPTSVSGGGTTRTTAPPSGTTAWVYHCKPHGISVKLPSSEWVESPKQTHTANFWCKRHRSPMIAALFSPRKESPEKFQAAVQSLKEEATRLNDVLEGPHFDEGANAAGNPYAYLQLVQKVKGGPRYVFVAKSYTYIKANGITVGVIFEGHGQMVSDLFQARECSEFEHAARTISLSVAADKGD